jgi:hypothetical protein
MNGFIFKFTEGFRRLKLDKAYKRGGWKDIDAGDSSAGLVFKGFVMLEGEPVKPHHFIVTEEEEGYLVSALKAPNQNKDSYVEVLLRPDHPMYERIQGAVSMLNIAGIQTEVEGVGESFQAGVYHVIVNDAEHAELIGSVK